MKHSVSRWTSVLILLLAIPAVVLIGAVLFPQRYSAFVSLIVTLLVFIPIFASFEKRSTSAGELAVLAGMIALSTVGRFVFAFLPGFKPVTALTILSAMYLGKNAGFAVGAMTAVLSNFYFGQGPWTPFQMLAWGLIGYLAGLLAVPLRKNRVALGFFGAAAGVLFSLLMDIWTVLWADGTFLFSRYLAAVTAALPVTLEYALSNLLFLWILAVPVGEKLRRVTRKYGLFSAESSKKEDLS